MNVYTMGKNNAEEGGETNQFRAFFFFLSHKISSGGGFRKQKNVHQDKGS